MVRAATVMQARNRQAVSHLCVLSLRKKDLSGRNSRSRVVEEQSVERSG